MTGRIAGVLFAVAVALSYSLAIWFVYNELAAQFAFLLN